MLSQYRHTNRAKNKQTKKATKFTWGKIIGDTGGKGVQPQQILKTIVIKCHYGTCLNRQANRTEIDSNIRI